MSHQGYQALSAKDVVFVEGFEQSAALFKADSTRRMKDLLGKIAAICTQSGELSTAEIELLFGSGITCEVLRPGASDWQTGQLQLQFAFVGGGVSGDVVMPAVVRAPIAVPAATGAATATVAAPAAEPAAEPVVEPVSQFDAAIADMDGFDDDAIDFAAVAESAAAESAVAASVATPAPAVVSDEFGLLEAMDSFSLDSDSLDSTAVPAQAMEGLEESPWELGDLDDMLMVQ
jgi:hypothetical protein